MNPRPWQRQPGESPADFTAFVAYLRLKGRRSHHATAQATGRKLGAIRRLSAAFNWPGRIAAYELRLADATQDALDSILVSKPAASKSELEQLQVQEFLLVHKVLQQSSLWLKRASDPRRRNVSLGQVCTLIALASKLGRLSTGMPTGDEKPRRKRREDMPGYWTGPTLEQAIERIYGPESSTPNAPARPPTDPPAPVAEPSAGTSSPTPPADVTPPASQSPPAGESPSTPSDSPPPPTIPVPQPSPTQRWGRRDAWSTWARHQRALRSSS